MSNSLELIFVKARNAEKRGDHAEAAALYEAILRRFPANARARKLLAALPGTAGEAEVSLPRADFDALLAWLPALVFSLLSPPDGAEALAAFSVDFLCDFSASLALAIFLSFGDESFLPESDWPPFFFIGIRSDGVLDFLLCRRESEDPLVSSSN